MALRVEGVRRVVFGFGAALEAINFKTLGFVDFYRERKRIESGIVLVFLFQFMKTDLVCEMWIYFQRT